MTTEKSQNQVIQYLEELDENKNYPADFAVFISEINKRIMIPIRIRRSDGEISAEEYSLSYLLSLPGPSKIGFNFGDSLVPYAETLKNPANLETYLNTLESYLEAESVAKPSTIGGEGVTATDITYNSMADVSIAQDIYSNIIDWNTANTEDVTYSVDDPKIPGLVAAPSKAQDQDTGDIYFKSYDFYSGPNMAINENNQYIDPKTGELKKDGEGNVLTPIFRAGSASSVFEGLTKDAIFDIQKELISLGLDPSTYGFDPGVVDFTAKGEEIDFVAQLMVEANDANAMFPQLNLIDKNAPTLIGMLRPYLDYKKGVDENTNVFLESLREGFAGEIVPPTESEVKAVVDKLFIERGINPTARDYQKYATIFGNLQKDAATRQSEIENNKLSLGDVIGLSTTYDTTTDIGPYTYGGFGVTTPTAAEAREQLGKPLLQPIDAQFELAKIIDDLEAGRIDASQEFAARTAAAQEFKRNFMVFEENF
tara:strand:+ start:8194 stop:9639 length:1446 start_codon:yes stop_codon:yes gene_type:complete